MKNKEERSFEELRQLVLEWAADRDLLSKNNIEGQSKKVAEEATEMLLAAMKTLWAPSMAHYEELVDGVGDTLVTVIILSELFNAHPVRALGAAYDVIKDRTGTTKNGQFVKDDEQQTIQHQQSISGEGEEGALRVLGGPSEEPDCCCGSEPE